jgi:hypothetical protein
MNLWMKHPRVDKASFDAFEAERAERRGSLAVARDRYREAAEGFAQIALTVPADYPNTRSDLAVAAVVSYGRAGDFGRAVELAGRMLAESPALNDYGRAELARLMREYSALIGPAKARPGPAATRGRDVWGDVRHRFDEAA